MYLCIYTRLRFSLCQNFFELLYNSTRSTVHAAHGARRTAIALEAAVHGGLFRTAGYCVGLEKLAGQDDCASRDIEQKTKDRDIYIYIYVFIYL